MVYMLDVLRTRKVSFIVALMDVEEFRLRDGWGNDGKRGSHGLDMEEDMNVIHLYGVKAAE